MKVTDYYDEFLNHQYSRDFLSIGKYPKEINSNFPNVIKAKLSEERLKYQNKLFYSISSIRDGSRISDRLFFDFDLENKEYKKLTSSYDARDMLFNSDILELPFYEASIAYDFLKEQGLKPYPIATNSKGFHLYCFFEPVQLENINLISMEYAKTMQEELNLKTIDFAVNKDAHKRKARLPYSRHDKTDLFVTPCNVNDDLSDILSDAVNPTIAEFDLSAYIAKGFSERLKETDIELSSLLAEQNEIRLKKRQLKRQSQKDVIYHKEIDFSEINMRELVRDIIPDLFVKSQGSYDIYNCPFHDDQHHSCGCYEKRFFCSACQKSWNYYDFISEFYELTEPKEIINELKGHLR